MKATGPFEVKPTAHTPYDSADGVTLARTTFAKTFHGELEATSTVEMLSAGTAVKDSAGYVALERVTGTLHGKRGAFILQHNGTMKRGAPSLTVTVVPDSATGELSGLSGSLQIDVVDGKHRYTFEYDRTA